MQPRVPFVKYWLVMAISLVSVIGLNCIILYCDVAKYSDRYQDVAKMLYAQPLWKQMLYNGVGIPIVEEILFRGVLFRCLRLRLTLSIAMGISAVMFGLYHGNLVQFIYATLMGLLLAYLYECFESIVAPMLAHATMNIVSIIMTETGAFTWILGQFWCVVLAAIICTLFFCILLRQIWKTTVKMEM